MAQKSDFRLPENVRPLRYQVTLEPNLEKFTFDGSADIGIVVNEETDTIVLNAIELQIASAVITDKQGGTAKATDIIFDQNLLIKGGILIIHRKKTTKEKLPDCFRIIDERIYGISKIIFGKFLY